jgi:Mn2+/Fe2+ NRAMP family transporter
MAVERMPGRARASLRRICLPRTLRVLGPGLVAGASDNDPTTVATVAVVGSTTTYALGWVALLILPMLAVVQAIAARVGVVSRRGLGDVVSGRYGRRWSLLFLLSLLPVNLITLAADLKAGAGALALLSGLDLRWFIVPLALAAFALPASAPYPHVRRVLQLISLSLLAYGAAAVAVRPQWSAVLRGSLVPSMHINAQYTAGALALLGTTLTSYVYVWETVELSEERPRPSVRSAQLDALVGAFFVVAVFWFILIATGATLGVQHRHVQTALQAATALRPAAGAAASAIFGAALLSSALLALPILTAGTAHALGAYRGWPHRIEHAPSRARAFYATIAAACAVAAGVAFAAISPIRLLFVASIAGAVATPATLLFLLVVARDQRTMGGERVSRALALAGYAVALVVAGFGVVALATL